MPLSYEETREQPTSAAKVPERAVESKKSALRGKDFGEQEAALAPASSAPPIQMKAAASGARAVQREEAPEAPAAEAPAPEAAAAGDNELFDPAKHMAAMQKDYTVAPWVPPAAPALPTQLPSHLQSTRDGAAGELQKIADRETAVTADLAAAQKAHDEATAAGDAAHIEKAAELVSKLKTDAATLAARRDELAGIAAKAAQDLQVATSPASSPAQLNDLCARRGVQISTDATSDESTTGWQFGPSGWSRTAKAETTNMAAGNSVGQTDEVKDTIDLSGASTKRTKTTEIKGANDTSVKSTETKTAGVGLDGSVSWGEGKSEEESDKTGSSKVSSGTKTKVGLGGYERSEEKATTVDGTHMADKKSTTVSRGDGQITVGRASESTVGKVDGAGELTEGTTHKTSVKGGVIAKEDEVGALGSATAERKSKSDSGITTGLSGGLNGRFTVSVKPVDAATNKYKIVLTIKLGASIGANVGGEKGDDTKGSAGVKANASGSVTAVYSHEMSADEVKAYQANLGIAAGGSPANGQYPEFAILAAGVNGGWDAAKQLYQGVSAEAFDSADITKGLREGDELSVTKEASVGGGVELGGSSGKGNVGIEAGGSTGTSIKLTKSMKGGQVIYGVEIGDDVGYNVGGKAGYGVAGMGLSNEHKEGQKSSVSLKLDPKSPNASAIAAQLNAAKTRADIDAIIRQYPELVASRSTEQTEEDVTKTSVDIAGVVTAEVGSGAARGHKETVDDKGETTIEDEGANSGSLEIGIGGVKVGASSEEKLSGSVSGGKASADLKQTDSETDLTKTLLGVEDAARRSPVSVVTGAASAPKKSESVAGMALSDSDISALMERAKDPQAWMKGMHGKTDAFIDYQALGRQIAAAGGNKEAVVKAMADFVGTKGSGRDDMLQLAVRGGAGGDGGGSAYYFPDGLGGLKAKYDAIVVGDPVEGITKLEQEKLAGGPPTADALELVMTKANGTLGQLEQLEVSFKSYTPNDEEKRLHTAAMQEMLAKIAQRKEEVRAKIRTLKGGNPDELSHADKVQQYNDLLTNCIGHKDMEKSSFAEIERLYGAGHEAIAIAEVLKQIRDLYVVWDKEFGKMTELAEENKIGTDRYFKFQPDRARFAKAQQGPPGGENEMQRPQYESKKEAQRAPADPVGDSQRELEKKQKDQAAAIRGQLNGARLKASAAYNTLGRKVQAGGQSGAANEAFEEGRKLFNSAEAQWQKLQKGASIDDMNSYGFIAMQDFNSAYDAFKRGQAS